ncbi:fasciclin domain-containing protein [Novosphingopyxis iocasae]|uniref:fasciclin domain-containing protein n=1 Tax=Novosphingopyxis iocasae TaxID=2762729 RepID=UPI0016515751|nr:fasciclin domain-containing protein [Novosphingopyxis iocasae]
MRGAFLLMAGACALASCGGDPIEAGSGANAQPKDKDVVTPVVHEIKIVDALATLRQHPDFTIFADLVRRSGLTPRLTGKAPVTVFAPTDSAFDKLSEERRKALLDPAQRPALAAFVAAHILVGRASARDLSEAIRRAGQTGQPAQFRTLAGKVMTVTRTDLNTAEAPPAGETDVPEAVPSEATNELQVSEEGGGTSLVTATDMEATNGVVHALESVL